MMAFRVFQYPLPTPPELDDLNSFLATQRIATVQHQIVDSGAGPLLVFIVETIGSGGNARLVSASSGPKTDYRELLSEDDFALFSQLRTVRKQIADAEGVPVYTIFSNAQLAEMVQRRVTTAAAMGEIAGIGKARVEKYASQFTPLLQLAFHPSQDPPS